MTDAGRTPDETSGRLDLMPDAMRVTADGFHRPHLDQCDGECHEVDYDDCLRCCSGVMDVMCDDCRFYAAQDAEGGAS